MIFAHRSYPAPSGPSPRHALRGALRRALRGAACLMLLGAGWPAQAADAGATAEFVYNVARFTEWPAASARPASLVLCASGAPAFGQLAGRRLQGRALTVRPLPRTGRGGDCQLLFIARPDQARLAELLHGAHESHALTLSNIAGFAEAGGMIGLAGGGKIVFDVNTAAAQRAGLRISSELLKLARHVVAK